MNGFKKYKAGKIKIEYIKAKYKERILLLAYRMESLNKLLIN
jgi:hypothetical protein